MASSKSRKIGVKRGPEHRKGKGKRLKGEGEKRIR
jgi:hypothetical protein